MRIVWLSDLNIKGSGYLNITLPICDRLQKSGHEVKVVGLEYKGEEHFFDFSILPAANLKEAMGVLQNLWYLWKYDVLIVAMDIPIQEFILKAIPGKEFPYIGIMPLESDPLCVSWAMVLMQMDVPLIISKFGVEEAQKLGVDAEYLPIGIDISSWRPPTQEERENVRKSLGIDKDTFVILTVAENQERKNLSAAMEIVAKFSEDKDVKYLMVTRENTSVGWKLRDYAQLLKINNKISIFEKGIPFAELWMLYAASDLFLLSSKSEGLCLPILEAMATKLPVAGTDCTAVHELLEESRGILLPPAYQYVDPFGNGHRYFVDVEKAVDKLNEFYCNRNEVAPIMTDKALEFVQARTWDITVESMQAALKKVEMKNEKSANSSLYSGSTSSPILKDLEAKNELPT